MPLSSRQYAKLYGLKEIQVELKHKSFKTNEDVVVEQWIQKNIDILEKNIDLGVYIKS